MAEAIRNPRFRYDLVSPKGRRTDRTADVAGYIPNMQDWVDLQLHAEPEGTRIENLRAIDKKGNDLPIQPELLVEYAETEGAKVVRASVVKSESLPPAQPE